MVRSNLTWVGIGGGFDGPNPRNFMEFIRRAPDGSTVTVESVMRNVLPINVMGMCHGHACPLRQRGHALRPPTASKMTSVQQIEQLVEVAKELGREIATGQGSARNLQDRRAVQQRRRDAGAARHGAEPRARPPRASQPVRRMTVEAERQHPVPRYAWVVFALTFGLLISDYMARQVLNAVFPLLKAEWALTDAQLGLLSGVVAIMVGLLTFPLSLVADRWGRVKSLTAMAVLWSLATLLCAVAGNYQQMLAGRVLVGVGEAAYGSVGIAVVVSAFPKRLRATLSAAFMAGGLLGQVLGRRHRWRDRRRPWLAHGLPGDCLVGPRDGHPLPDPDRRAAAGRRRQAGGAAAL